MSSADENDANKKSRRGNDATESILDSDLFVEDTSPEQAADGDARMTRAEQAEADRALLADDPVAAAWEYERRHFSPQEAEPLADVMSEQRMDAGPPTSEPDTVVAESDTRNDADVERVTLLAAHPSDIFLPDEAPHASEQPEYAVAGGSDKGAEVVDLKQRTRRVWIMLTLTLVGLILAGGLTLFSTPEADPRAVSSGLGDPRVASTSGAAALDDGAGKRVESAAGPVISDSPDGSAEPVVESVRETESVIERTDASAGEVSPADVNMASASEGGSTGPATTVAPVDGALAAVETRSATPREPGASVEAGADGAFEGGEEVQNTGLRRHEWYVNLESVFENEEVVREKIRTLAEWGIHAERKTVYRASEKPWIRLRVIGFWSEQEARDFAEKIKREHEIGSWLSRSREPKPVRPRD